MKDRGIEILHLGYSLCSQPEGSSYYFFSFYVPSSFFFAKCFLFNLLHIKLLRREKKVKACNASKFERSATSNSTPPMLQMVLKLDLLLWQQDCRDIPIALFLEVHILNGFSTSFRWSANRIRSNPRKYYKVQKGNQSIYIGKDLFNVCLQKQKKSMYLFLLVC